MQEKLQRPKKNIPTTRIQPNGTAAGGTMTGLLPEIFLFGVLILISYIDARTYRIPDALSLPLMLVGLLLAFLSGPAYLLSSAVGAFAGFLSLWGVGEIFFRLRGHEGLGVGDAKLFGAAGAWLGWHDLPLVLLIASVSGLAFALAMSYIRRGRRLAFGPWISLGFFFVFVFR